MAKCKVLFGIPTEGHTPPESFQKIRLMAFRHGFLQADSRGKDVEFEFFDATSGRMFTPMARERLAERALAIGADYLFMVDDDMIAQADLFEKLYRHQVDIVAPLAFTRNSPYLAVLYSITEGWDPLMHRSFITSEWIKNWPRQKLVECDAVGFGAVLIKTSVLRKMSPPYFMCSSGTGEDIWFCHRAKKEAEAKVFMDTTVELGHIGAPVIIDTVMHDEHNNININEKLYGPYRKHGVYDVCHNEPVKSQDPEVLAL